jgi:hypothetical protein
MAFLANWHLIAWLATNTLMTWRAVNKADIPAVKEPTGLYRSDGK